jgi:23S rRNA (cytidine1920-2'-O)/16S rRNA (cytidine1409-2'-O)-methyltransferase
LQAEVVALVKPQFEVGKGEVGKGGIVRSAEQHQQVLREIRDYAEQLGFLAKDLIESPIKGAKGNTEFLMYFVWNGKEAKYDPAQNQLPAQ